MRYAVVFLVVELMSADGVCASNWRRAFVVWKVMHEGRRETFGRRG